jgi:hypothetical protein
LSLRILVDEDSQSRHLVRLLREAGHDVLTVNEAEMRGAMDPTVLAFADAEGRALLTANVRDFRLLHDQGTQHSGVLAVCHDGDPAKDMTRADIVQGLGNLEASGAEVVVAFHVLNA